MKTVLKIITVVAVACFGKYAQAQQDGLQLGSFNVFPTLGLSYGYDDNVSFLFDQSRAISSNFFVFSPGVRVEAEGEKISFLGQYDYSKTSFNSDSRYNFDRQQLLFNLGYFVSNRSQLEVSVEYLDGSDRIGTGNQQGGLIDLNLDPDQWHSFGVGGKWHYGGVGAKGALDFDLGYVDMQYDNNEQFTATRNRQARYFGVTYSHRVSPKTTLLAQFKRTNIDYDAASLDNTETRYMFGTQWQATGKTSARALVGYLIKDFEQPQHNDFNGLAIETGLTWSPRSYSIFDLSLSRETDETNGNGSFVVRNTADIGWTHFWRDRFSTTANIGLSEETYKGSLRSDDLSFYGISAKYQFSDWLVSGLGYRHANRTSSINEFEYKDNSVMLTLELSK